MNTTIEKIENIVLSNGFKLTNIEKDEEVIRGNFRVNNNDLSYDTPYGICSLFEDELTKINSLPEIDDVEISNLFTEHYDDLSYDYIVEFLAFTE